MPVERRDLDIFPFYDHTPDWVCIAGKDGYFISINQAVVDTLNYSKQELLTLPISHFIHPDDKKITASRRSELIDGKPLLNFENRYVTKEGDIVWMQWTSIYFPEQEVVFAIAKDVTQRKIKEREIEEKYRNFQSLAEHFKKALEKDKKTLANELHEELAQLATVIKVDINWLNDHLPTTSEAAKDRFNKALSGLQLLINSIRRISYAISPTMLDDLGLNETLEWLCNEFSRQNNIPCIFDSTVEDAQLSHEIQLDLFRICQEALNNVSEHANADFVTIRLKNHGHTVKLTIADNGKGFDVGKTTTQVGLTSILKRAASVNGHIEVDSKPGEGTSISVNIELPPITGNINSN